MKKIFLLLLFIISFSFNFSKAITLDEAIKEALEKNLEIKIENKNKKIDYLNIRINQHLFLPEYFFNISYTRLKDDVYTTIPPSPLIPVSLQFQQFNKSFKEIEAGINYLIFSSFQRINKVKLSKISYKNDILKLNQKKREIILKVKLAYIDVLMAKSLVNVWEKELEAVKSHLERVNQFYKKGYATKVEILQTKVRLSEVKRELRKARGNLKVAKANLNRILNRDINNDIDVEEIKVDIPDKLDLKILEDEAIRNREEIKILKNNIRQLELASDIYKAEFLPKVYFQAKYFYSDKFPASEPKSNYSVSIMMSIKFQGQIPYLKYKQEKEKAVKTKLIREKIKKDIELQVKSLYENYKTALDNLKVAKDTLEEAKEYYQMVVEQYKNQLASTTDVLDAEASLTKAREGYKISYYQLLKAYFELQNAIGKE